MVRVFVIPMKLHISCNSVLSNLRPWFECRTAGGPNREKMRLTKSGATVQAFGQGLQMPYIRGMRIRVQFMCSDQIGFFVSPGLNRTRLWQKHQLDLAIEN